MKIENFKIQRKRLMEFATQNAEYRVLYIQAPAGYGKTVFANYWLEKQAGPRVMITLDSYDDSINDLCQKLKNALLELYPDSEGIRSYAEHPAFDSAPAEFLMRAVSSMPKEKAISIAVDDLQYISNPDVQKLWAVFMGRLPGNAKVLILSRTAPAESCSGLILKNELLLIPQEYLLFGSEEIYQLYRKNHVKIVKKQAESILKYTEGWPIAINALLISGKKVPVKNMPHELLAEFLMTEVWETWDEKLRKFMIETSIEDELTEDLCNVLTGETESGRILEQLLSEGTFLVKLSNGGYRFHKLFQEFLQNIFDGCPTEYKKSKYALAGNYYLKKKDFYRAIEKYSIVKDCDSIALCFDLLEDMDRFHFDLTRVMSVVRNILDEKIADRYPHLLFMMAVTAYNDGRAEEFKTYADLYYANHAKVVAHNPMLAHNIFFLYAMDFRYTLQDIARMATDVQSSMSFQGVRGSATYYFPMYHRSFRDFCEMALYDLETSAAVMGQKLGALLGEEREMIIECICAGLYYEKGELVRAQDLALSSAAKIQNEFAPESKFCAMVIPLLISHAMGQSTQTAIFQTEIQNMIEADKAFYLQPNFDAVICRNQLYQGDMFAAGKWLNLNDTEIYNRQMFFELYRHLTTARAHIACENFDKAIIILLKIQELCEAMNRLLDTIESNILLAICYWKKKRSYQKTALSYLEKAIVAAQPYGFEQIFVNEGAELTSMLSHLKSRSVRSDYEGELSCTYVKRLDIGAARHALHSKGLTGGRVEQAIRFTTKQKRVMKLLCEGYSYKKIGEELGIKYSTVRSHIELIYKKLDVFDVKEAVLKIYELNIRL